MTGSRPVARSSLASSMRAIADALEEHGIAPDPVFREAGADPARRFVTGARYPLAQVAGIWRTAIGRVGDPTFGLSVARQIRPDNLYALGLAWLASESLLDAFRRLVRFNQLASTVVSLTLDESAPHPQLIIDLPNTPELEGLHVVHDGVVLSLWLLARELAGRPIAPLSVSLKRPPPRDSRPWRREFGCDVFFNAPRNRMEFDAAELRRRLPGGNREQALRNDRAAGAYLRALRQGALADDVRRRIVDLLPGGVTHKTIAAALNMSPRTLQRRLQSQQVSFSELLEDVREHLARAYLRDADMSVTDIAFLLGYSEPRNFARAFRRWTGVGPRAYRDSESDR